MLGKSLQIMIFAASTIWTVASPAFAGDLPPGELAGSGWGDPSYSAYSADIPFWGLPYPYGYAWQSCYVPRRVLTRYGHWKWYRVRVSGEQCGL
jgi:hypothetical protein